MYPLQITFAKLYKGLDHNRFDVHIDTEHDKKNYSATDVFRLPENVKENGVSAERVREWQHEYMSERSSSSENEEDEDNLDVNEHMLLGI